MYVINNNFFKNDSEQSFYVAGVVASDGCLIRDKGSYIIKLFLSGDLKFGSKNWLQSILNIMQSNHPLSVYTSKISKNSGYKKEHLKIGFKIYSKQLFNDLFRFNIHENKTYDYVIPEWMRSHSLRRHFIRGLVDGDGCFSVNNKHLYFSLLGTEAAMKMCKTILEKDCNITLNSRIKHITKLNTNIVEIRCNSNDKVKKIHKYLYENSKIYLLRKFNYIRIRKYDV